MKAAVAKATDERLFVDSPIKRIKSFEEQETKREFLTQDELIKLKNTPCEIPRLKDAALFSALTGLRWSDIYKLTWKNVQANGDEHVLRFRQKKTDAYETLPITQQAFELLGKEGSPSEQIFNELTFYTRNKPVFKSWIKDAGIKKHITFHCFRHTNATLLLTNGVDIFTVSKMLGHKHVKTTQIYTKVIDQKKIEAANKIKI